MYEESVSQADHAEEGEELVVLQREQVSAPLRSDQGQ